MKWINIMVSSWTFDVEHFQLNKSIKQNVHIVGPNPLNQARDAFKISWAGSLQTRGETKQLELETNARNRRRNSVTKMTSRRNPTSMIHERQSSTK